MDAGGPVGSGTGRAETGGSVGPAVRSGAGASRPGTRGLTGMPEGTGGASLPAAGGVGGGGAEPDGAGALRAGRAVEVAAARVVRSAGAPAPQSAHGTGPRSSIGGGGQSQEATKFEVRIRVDEKEELRPGMSVTADIETRYRTNVLTVPIQSVTTRLPKGAVDEQKKKAAKKDEDDLPEKKPGSKKQDEANKPMEVVFVTGSDTVKMMKVKRGIGDDEYVEITEGLTEGQEAVSGGYKALRDQLEDGKRIKRDNRPRSAREEKKSR